MKNVLLHTVNDKDNVGQIFSAYALYKTIEKTGNYTVEIDDRTQPNTKLSEYLDMHCCRMSEMHLHSTEEEHLKEFDVIVTGTEKIWCSDKMKSVEEGFLNWGKENVKRIAYAPSFGGACDLPLGPKNAAYFALKRFDGLSVSDKNTLAILNMEFGMNAEKVCNPILLLDTYPHLDASSIEGLFISAFFENRDEQKQKVVEMAEETLRYRVIDYSKDSKDIAERTADEYLNVIEKSSLIITDSAAICHLAIVYKKPFIVVLSKQVSASYECITTLEDLGLMERVIYVEDDVREKKYLCKKPIKYGMVDYILNSLREKSIDWLNNILN